MKNFDIASLQQRRFENYEKEKSNLIVVRVSDGYEVTNVQKATNYRVSRNPNSGQVECTCRDYFKHKEFNLKCKHKIAVIMQFSKTNTSAQVAEDNNINIKEENTMKSAENNQNNNHHTVSSKEVTIILQEVLSRPFPQELIRYREGQKKKQLAYVETVNYIDRLNEAFGFKWTWEIIFETVTEYEAYCKGRLTVEIGGKTVIKEAYGGKDLTIVDVWDKQTRQVIVKKPFSIADDLKSAGSDALKKACSLLGIGLHLYKSTNNNTTNAPAGPHTIPAAKPQAPAHTVPPVPVQKPTGGKPASATQHAGSIPRQNGGNGKGNNGNGGNGKTQIQNIIDRW